MKVTIEPETEAEKAKTQGATYAGLKSVAVIGIAYDGDVLRRPSRYSYGDLEDLMREFLPMAFDMGREIDRKSRPQYFSEGVTLPPGPHRHDEQKSHSMKPDQ